jgi:hypothetical protein
MKKTAILFIILVAAFLGCSKENVKPSADSLLATGAFSIIDNIKDAYEGKDRKGLKTHMDSPLAESIIKELSFESVELTFTPRMVKITDSVKVNLKWHGSWLITGDRKVDNRGVADLIFDRETMKLTYIDGDNPFITPIVK